MVSSKMDLMTLEERKPGYVPIKKSVLCMLLLAVLLVVVLVGVLSGVLAAKHEREVAEVKYGQLKTSTDSVLTRATEKPTTLPVTTQTTVKTTPKTTPKREVWQQVRLPENVVPYHYDLTIIPFIGNLTFRGVQKAYVQVTAPTPYILIHMKEMRIVHCRLDEQVSGGQQNHAISKTFEEPENQYFVVQAAKNLTVGRYVLTLNYESNVSTVLTGFYRSTYKAVDGRTRTLLTTKFQPTDARKAFPCFDEPALKATFTVTVWHETGYIALSNMPGTTEIVDAGWNRTTFQKTVAMSTYLICFIVCDFEHRELVTGIHSNVTLGVWSSPPHINSTKVALELGYNMTSFFEKFFKVLYPMPKLDMVAIPDYGSGATEHWGIITYRQARLLITDGVSSESNRQGSATIIAHELAHLWFGNLVTCKWWNDLWIQEGMASYTEYYGVANARPDWEMWDQFVATDWKVGMDLDALASSHPIIVAVEHPSQIKEIFDSITYNKGSSIIRMLDSHLGEETFRNGLARYLTKHQFDAATSDDLWAAFSEVSGSDVKAIMDTWTRQMGHPVVTIKRISATETLITQKHFLLDPKAKMTVASPFNYTWIVPLSIVNETQPTMPSSMLIKDSEVKISLSWPNNTWVKGNFRSTGFYRVNYDLENWKNLIKQLDSNHKVLTASDRAGMIDDAFALARAGLLDYATALSSTAYLGKEESYVAWKLALRNLGYLDKVLRARESYGLFRQYMIDRLRPMIKKLGWDMKGSHIEKFQRVMFLSAACNYGDPESLKKASQIFNDWMSLNKTIDSELRTLVLYYGVASGGVKEWEFVFAQYKQERDPSIKAKLQYALSGSQVPWILNKWLGYTLDNSIVRSQDTVYVISDVADNPVGKYVAWDFSRANWKKLMAIASANNFHSTKLTLGITQQFTTKFELDQMNEFWKQEPDAGSAERARSQAAERIQASIDWVGNYADVVEQWLRKQAL